MVNHTSQAVRSVVTKALPKHTGGEAGVPGTRDFCVLGWDADHALSRLHQGQEKHPVSDAA